MATQVGSGEAMQAFPPPAPPRPRPRRFHLRLDWLVLPASAVAALGVGAVMLAALGANPVDGYHALVTGAFGSGYALSATAVKAVPLLLVGVGICIAFRANVFNIGGEGQIAMGALAATATALALPNLPSVLLILLVLLAGALGGGVWGAIPGAFKGYFGVNEILSTIMMNLVAVQLMNYLLAGPLVDHTSSVGGLIPQTRLLPEPFLAAASRARNTAAPRRADCGRRRPRRLCAPLAHQLRLPNPGGRPLARSLDIRRDARCAYDDVGTDAERGDVRSRRFDARLRIDLAPDGDRRVADGFHRVGRVQRDRGRALWWPQSPSGRSPPPSCSPDCSSVAMRCKSSRTCRPT